MNLKYYHSCVSRTIVVEKLFEKCVQTAYVRVQEHDPATTLPATFWFGAVSTPIFFYLFTHTFLIKSYVNISE